MLIDEQTYAPGQTGQRKLKPSEAIRIGAALRPQCMNNYFMDGGSCALGAYWEGAGMAGDPPQCPIDGFLDLPGKLANEVWRKNDSGWTREQIADWLEAQGK